MQMLREHRCRLVWLALAAMAGQIVLTFGHVHAHEGDGAPHAALPAHHATDHAHDAHHNGPEDDVPGNDAPEDDAHIVCVFCRAMVQAETLVLPGLPPLRFQHARVKPSPIFARDASRTTARAAPFASRAPPVAPSPA